MLCASFGPLAIERGGFGSNPICQFSYQTDASSLLGTNTTVEVAVTIAILKPSRKKKEKNVISQSQIQNPINLHFLPKPLTTSVTVASAKTLETANLSNLNNV